MNNNKIRVFLSAAIAFSLMATGCSSDKNGNSGKSKSLSESESSSSSEKNTDIMSEQNDTEIENSASDSDAIYSKIKAVFSDRDLNPDTETESTAIKLSGNSAEINGSGATADGSEIIITDEGVYTVSGTLNNGQIIVNSEAKVQIILDNAEIVCEYSAPIYVENADKTFITLAENSVNTLTDGSSYTYENEGENEPDAAVFSHDSLTINGSGALIVNANYNEGITSKDDIVITGGDITVNSVGNGMKGKDYIAVCNAELDITSGGDGMKSNNVDEPYTGFIYAESGTFNIVSGEDGIQADSDFIAVGGDFNIVSGGGSENSTKQHNDFFGGGGRPDFNNQELSSQTDTETVSTKSIKSGNLIDISGGNYVVDSADDALHSDGNITISGGVLTFSSGDDGIHAGAQLDITGGNITVSESYEGIEAAVINIKGGSVDVVAEDDGFNASNGSSQGPMGSYTEGVELNISGGFVCVDAGGDGLDSNGNFTVNGGTTLVNGPTNSGNGALDGNNGINCNGGLLIAAGSSGMAESPDNTSEQCSVSVTLDSTRNAGTLITLCGSDGEIVSFAPSKSFDNIVISSPDIAQGGEYTVYAGGSSSAEENHGLYAVGGYNDDGVEVGSFIAEDMTTYIGSRAGMNGGFGGGFPGGGGFGGGRGDWGDFEMPTDENGNPEMPEGGMGGRGDFDPFGGEMPEMPTDESGRPEMPQGGFDGGNMW